MQQVIGIFPWPCTVLHACRIGRGGSFYIRGYLIFKESLGRTDFPSHRKFACDIIRSIKERLMFFRDVYCLSGHGSLTSSSDTTKAHNLVAFTTDRTKSHYDRIILGRHVVLEEISGNCLSIYRRNVYIHEESGRGREKLPSVCEWGRWREPLFPDTVSE